MANRYWVGGSGTWVAGGTTKWSAASALSFSGSRAGTTLTTVGSPALVIGMTVWDATNTSLGTITGGSGNTWTTSGSGTVALQAMTAATIGATVPTAADSAIFDANSTTGGSYTVTLSGAITCLDLTSTGPAATFTSTGTPTVSGNFSLNASNVWSATGTITFGTGAASRTVTTNGVSLACGVVFSSTGSTFTLGSAFTITGSLTITAGTLNTSASNYAISCSNPSISNSCTLTLNGSTFTATGTLISFGATSTLNAGSSQFNCTNTGSITFQGGGQSFNNVSFTGAPATTTSISFSGANLFNNLTITPPSAPAYRETTYAASQTINGTLTGSGASEVRRITYFSNTFNLGRALILANPTTISNADFRDIGATLSAITATSSGGNCGGNSGITFSTPKTVYWNLAGAQNWSATGWATTSTGTPAVANFPLAQDTAVFTDSGSVTGTITIEAAWNIGTLDMSGRTSAMTLANGTTNPTIYGSWLNGSGTTLSGTGVIYFRGRGTQQLSGNGRTFTQSVQFENIGGTIRLASATAFGSSCNFFSGTLDLQSYTLTCTTFSSSVSTTRAIAFGTGNITVNGTGTVWNTSTTTGLTVTGTPVVSVANATATATTITAGTPTEANTISFNFTTGTYALTLTTSGAHRNLDFTGFSGSVGNSAILIYGDLNLGTTATFSAGANAWVFASTSATPRTITSNGKTMDFPLSFQGVGGTWALQDALTLGSTRPVGHTNGTINLNGKTLTVGSAYSTNAGTKNLTFNGGTLVCPAASPAAFNNANPAGFTTTAGTGVGTISMTSASAKTFVGGGSTFNCTLNQGGAGALTITGANTFNNIANSVQPASILFTAGTTNTFNNFSLSGTAGNLITIASATAATHTLSKASGTVSVDYLSITNSTATGGAAWYAGVNSTDGGGNTGWLFSAPGGNTGAFFSIL